MEKEKCSKSDCANWGYCCTVCKYKYTSEYGKGE